MTAISPRVTENIHLESSKVALHVTADAHVDLHRVTCPGGDEFLFAGQLDLTRKARFNGSIGHKVVNEDLLLGAKATADSRLDDTQLTHGEAKNLRDNAACVPGNLRARHDDDLSHIIRIGECRMCLHRSVLSIMRLERLRDGHLGFRQCLVAVSYTHLRAHETRHDLVCRLLLE